MIETTLGQACFWISVSVLGVFCVAGFRCALYGGPGLFELIGMLWRCEVKSRPQGDRESQPSNIERVT